MIGSLSDNLISTIDSNIEQKYQNYILEHKNNVRKSYNYIKENVPEVIEMLPDDEYFDIDALINNHDESKYDPNEFDAYAEYFYGTKTTKVKQDFDYAWLHHIHNNPHHWQYWLLVQDDDSDKILDMPIKYIVEMFCDHWSFSWRANNLGEIKNWYNEHKSGIQLSSKTKEIYEKILNLVMENLEANGKL